MSESTTQRPPTRYQGARFSLASILLLTAVVAIFLGAIRAGLQAGGADRSSAMALYAALGCLVGIAVGLATGQGQIARARSTVIGILAGALAGAGAGVLAALPKGLMVIIPGAFLLVAFAAVVYRLSRATRTPSRSPGSHPE